MTALPSSSAHHPFPETASAINPSQDPSATIQPIANALHNPSQSTSSNSSHHHRPTSPIDDPLARDFPHIGKMCKEDLRDLLNDPDYFNAIFIRQPIVKDMLEKHESLISTNHALVERNLSLRPKLENLRDRVASSFNQTQQFISEFEILSKQQADLYQAFGESASRSRLLTALHESDKLAESLANQFAIEGLLEEEQFVKEFREERRKYHKRAWMANRWSEGAIRWD
ncbi:hypothetical protein O181_024219 [Austropuccinia psidii MF-1]|uniref:VPS37 C-terminal domain-containing protein n=1 Tax=Austropuccinia psidii MF-1 TaxID=1389203 RepID=A0A9Q3CI81_9BASI|nr:hypothetical protein [Austropuccinia psidii MF-1]